MSLVDECFWVYVMSNLVYKFEADRESSIRKETELVTKCGKKKLTDLCQRGNFDTRFLMPNIIKICIP
jgi:hypothetical protein